MKKLGFKVNKHIDIKYLAIQERGKEQKVIIEHVSNELMVADLLTKGMPVRNFREHLTNMGLGFVL